MEKELEISGTITGPGKMLIKSREKPTREETLKMVNESFRFADDFTGKINGFQYTKEELKTKTK